MAHCRQEYLSGKEGVSTIILSEKKHSTLLNHIKTTQSKKKRYTICVTNLTHKHAFAYHWIACTCPISSIKYQFRCPKSSTSSRKYADGHRQLQYIIHPYCLCASLIFSTPWVTSPCRSHFIQAQTQSQHTCISYV